MRILLLTQVVPYPPDSGPKIKTYNVLRYFAARHRVHLVSFVRTAAEAANARALRPYCAGVTTVPLRRSRVRDAGYLARSVVSGRPFLIERDDVQAMRTTVSRLVREQTFDAAHADQLSMGQFAVDLPVSLRVLDEHPGGSHCAEQRNVTMGGLDPAGDGRIELLLDRRGIRATSGDKRDQSGA